MKRHLTRLAFVLVTALLLYVTAFAAPTVLVSSIRQELSLLRTKDSASSFTVPVGNAFTIEAINVSTVGVSPPPGELFAAYIYSDNGGEPGSELADFGILQKSTALDEILTFTGSFTPTGGTTYWVVVRENPQGDPAFENLYSDVRITTTRDFVQNSGYVLSRGINSRTNAVTAWVYSPPFTLQFALLGTAPISASVRANDADAIEEPTDNGQVTISLSAVAPTDITVNYTVTGTATNGLDYTTLTGSVTILAGRTTAVVNVMPRDDALDEGDETVVFTLATGPGYTIGNPNRAEVIIRDDDRGGSGDSDNALPPDPLLDPLRRPGVHIRQLFDDGQPTPGNSYSNIGVGSGAVYDAYTRGDLWEAWDIYGLDVANATGAPFCLDGIGTAYYIDGAQNITLLAGTPAGTQTCVILPGDGIVVLIR